MDSEAFTYWLQGFVELSGDRPTEQQWDLIKKHLQLVFKNVTKEDSSLPDVEARKTMQDYFKDLDGSRPVPLPFCSGVRLC